MVMTMLQEMAVALLVNKCCRLQRPRSLVFIGFVLGLCVGCSMTLLVSMSVGNAGYAWDPVSSSVRLPLQLKASQDSFGEGRSGTSKHKHESDLAGIVKKIRTLNVTTGFNMEEADGRLLQDLYAFHQTLLVAVVGDFSYQFHKEMVEVVYTSWGQDVSHIVFFFGEQGALHTDDTDWLEAIYLPELSGDKAFSVQGRFAVLRYVNDHYMFDYDWLLIVPLNVYVNGWHLKETLARMNPEEMVYLGRPVALSDEISGMQTQSQEYYCNTDTGVVFSRALLQRLIPHLTSCLEAANKDSDNNSTLMRGREGINLGRCVSNNLGTQCTSGSAIASNQLFFQDTSHKYKELDALVVEEEFLHQLFTFSPIENSEQMLLLHFLYKTSYYNRMDKKISDLRHLIKLLCEVMSRSILDHPRVQAECAMHNNLGTSTVSVPTPTKFQPSNHSRVQSWISYDKVAMYEDESVVPKRWLGGDKDHKHEFEVALTEAIRVVTTNNPTKLTFRRFLHGWVKRDSITGVEYIIDMRFSYSKNMRIFTDRRVHLLKPLASNFIVWPTKSNTSKTVHFIVPMANVTSRFDEFVQMYKMLLHSRRGMLYLVFVVYGDEEFQHVSQVVSDFLRKHSEAKISVIPGIGMFSRAKALDLGIQQLQANDLAFFCDVDMIVQHEFLDKCRKNTIQGERVYYPEVFKMYNMDYVYWNQTKPKNFDISRSTGHWGYYAYGMLCIYKSDYIAAGGLNTKIVGWGGEDVEFYEHIVQKGLDVFRAPDSDLIHRWHSKTCIRPQNDDHKYETCMNSKAEALADRRELARYIFNMENKWHCRET